MLGALVMGSLGGWSFVDADGSNITSGLYYKCFTIIIYDRNDIGLYYKTRDNHN
jgi:hypothetical protein